MTARCGFFDTDNPTLTELERHGWKVKSVRGVSLFLTLACFLSATSGADERPRLAVLTDIGGDPDDQQSVIRLMVYANEFLNSAMASGTQTTTQAACC